MRHLALLLAGAGLVLGLAACTGGDPADRPPAGRTGRGIHVEFRDASDYEKPGYLRMNLSGTVRYYHVSQEVLLDTDAVATAEIDTTAHSPRVVLHLTDEGAEDFAAITRERIGKRVGIIVDGLLLSAPMVMAEITGGQAVIEGKFEMAEAKRIVRALNQE